MLLNLIVSLSFFSILYGSRLCDDVGNFKNEKGQFSISWCFPTIDEIQITFSLNSTSFIAIGFGGYIFFVYTNIFSYQNLI